MCQIENRSNRKPYYSNSHITECTYCENSAASGESEELSLRQCAFLLFDFFKLHESQASIRSPHAPYPIPKTHTAKCYTVKFRDNEPFGSIIAVHCREGSLQRRSTRPALTVSGVQQPFVTARFHQSGIFCTEDCPKNTLRWQHEDAPVYEC